MHAKLIKAQVFAIFILFCFTLAACGSNSGSEGEEESGIQYGINETYDEVRRGAGLILDYDEASDSFIGTVENTTDGLLERVRVEVHLSNGVELGPTTPSDLAGGATIEISLTADGNTFETWSAHPEVGAAGEHEGEHEGEDGEHEEGGED